MRDVTANLAILLTQEFVNRIRRQLGSSWIRRGSANIWAKSKGQRGRVTVLSKAPLIVLTLVGSPGLRPCYNPAARLLSARQIYCRVASRLMFRSAKMTGWRCSTSAKRDEEERGEVFVNIFVTHVAL